MNATGAAAKIFMVVNMASDSYAQMQFQGIAGATYPDTIVWDRNNSLGYAFEVYDISTSTSLFHVTDAGDATLAGTLTTGSARARKKNIRSLADPTEKIMSLNPVSFNFKDSGLPSLGFIAEEVKDVFSELVSGAEENLALNYSGLIAPLVATVQAQQKKIDQLESTIKEIFLRLNQ